MEQQDLTPSTEALLCYTRERQVAEATLCRPWILHATDDTLSTIDSDPHAVPVFDLRRAGDDIAQLDSGGFCLVGGLDAESSVALGRRRTEGGATAAALCDAEATTAAAAVLRGALARHAPSLGAGCQLRLVPFDVTWRSAQSQQAQQVNSKPVQRVHVDQDFAAAVRRKLRHAPAANAERFLIVNVWRPTSAGPVVDFPLTVADARSVAVEDLVTTHLRGFGDWLFDTQYVRVRYNSRHRWYYAPRMHAGEALVFKIFDSRAALCQPPEGAGHASLLPGGAVPHTAFEDRVAVQCAAAAGESVVPRSSVEVRFLVLVNPSEESNKCDKEDERL